MKAAIPSKEEVAQFKKDQSFIRVILNNPGMNFKSKSLERAMKRVERFTQKYDEV